MLKDEGRVDPNKFVPAKHDEQSRNVPASQSIADQLLSVLPADIAKELKARQEHEKTIIEAKIIEGKAAEIRRKQMAELVRLTFWAIDKKGCKRSPKTMAKAYATADELAAIGGEDYNEAVRCLAFAYCGKDADEKRQHYYDACAAMLIGIND